MYRLLLFLRRIYVLVIFLVLEGFALHFYAGSTTHSRARLLSVSDRVTSGVYGVIADARSYFSLGRTNRELEARVQALENELDLYRTFYTSRQRDSIRATVPVRGRYLTARIVRNSVNKRENWIMVDRGSQDGVGRGMALLSLGGAMVGYVESVSEHNAVCVSVLNAGFRASGEVAGTGHFGSISWQGFDPRTVRLSEVPKYAAVARGDTIRTSGYSFNFPEGVLVGTVEDFEIDEATASYNIDVRLGADIGSLGDVILVDRPEVYERVLLERQTLGGEPGDEVPQTGEEGGEAPQDA